jgi:hypothetical protein
LFTKARKIVLSKLLHFFSKTKKQVGQIKPNCICMQVGQMRENRYFMPFPKKTALRKNHLSTESGARRFRSIEPINKKHMAGELLCAYVPYKPI